MPFIISEDSAIKTYVTGMLVADEKSATRPVKVWYGYPDIELRVQDFPFLTIDLIDVTPGRNRQMAGIFTDNDMQGTITPVSGISYTYEVPVAFDLQYQITTYARHPRHDRAIITQMFQKFPNNRAFLPVLNDLETATAYRHMFLELFTKRDTVEGENGNKRLLRNVYTINVMSELPPAAATSALKNIATVNLNRNASNSWTQQTVPSTLQIV